MFRVTIISLLAHLIFHLTFPHNGLLEAKTIRQKRYEAQRQNRSNNKIKSIPEKLPRKQNNGSRKNRNQRKETSDLLSVSLENFSFTIPHSWQCITEKTQIPEKLEAICIGPKGVGLTPTITIGCEKTKISTQEYLDEILNYHSQEENSVHCSLFTTVESPEGVFNIIKVEKLTSFGEVALLQAIFLKNDFVYIFTGTSLKENVGILSEAFVQCVSSFKLPIQNTEQTRDLIEETILNAFKACQKMKPSFDIPN